MARASLRGACFLATSHALLTRSFFHSPLSLSPSPCNIFQFVNGADQAKVKKLQEQLEKFKTKSTGLEAELANTKSDLTKTQEQLASALSRIEISSAAAVGEAQKLMSEKINEAYKEGQRDAQRFLKEMRSMF